MKPIVSHAVHMVIVRIAEDGKVEVAMMPYTKGFGTSKAFTTLRLPTETRRNGESVNATTIRGVTAEVAADRNEFEVAPWGSAYAELGSDQNDPNGLHAKIAVVMKHTHGELRHSGQVDEDDPDEYHGPMQWIDVRELLEEKTAPRSIFSHKVAVSALVDMLIDKLPETGYRYHDLQGSHKGKGLVNDEEREALRAYMARV